MKTFYNLAIECLNRVNDGSHLVFSKPENPYPKFSYDTFRRACHGLRTSVSEREKRGREWVEANWRGAGKPLTASRILEKVVVDHTELDGFVVVDPKRKWMSQRLWLTLAIDVHSRAVLAWVLTVIPPSYWTVCRLLERMLVPKRPPSMLVERHPVLKRICGRPNMLIVDNGAEFRSTSMRDLAGSAGISVWFTAIKLGRKKAIGERALGTIPRLLLECVPGRTLGIEHNRVSGENPQDKAEITLEGMEALANWAVAEYHVTPHEGLNDQPPALVFEKSANKHGIDIMCDMRSARLEILEVEENVQITKSGARLFSGLRYYSAIEVSGLLDRNLRFEPRRLSKESATIHTKVKYDPSDIAKVWAWDRSGKRYVELICQEQSYADGMPLGFHRELVETARAEGHAFSSEAERIRYRAIRIAAIKDLAPKAAAREREALARLAEHPRIRQVTGSLVALNYEPGAEVKANEFIEHDVASMTSFDAEVLHGTPVPRRHEPIDRPRDRRDASSTHESGGTAPRRRTRRSAAAGKSAA